MCTTNQRFWLHTLYLALKNSPSTPGWDVEWCNFLVGGVFAPMTKEKGEGHSLFKYR